MSDNQVAITSDQIRRYVQTLRRNESNREYVVVLERPDLPGVGKYVWISNDFCHAEPTQAPATGDQLGLVIENKGFRSVSVSFSCESTKRKMTFGASAAAVEIQVDVPPRLERHSAILPERRGIVVTDVQTLFDVLVVNITTRLNGTPSEFNSEKQLIYRFK